MNMFRSDPQGSNVSQSLCGALIVFQSINDMAVLSGLVRGVCDVYKSVDCDDNIQMNQTCRDLLCISLQSVTTTGSDVLLGM